MAVTGAWGSGKTSLMNMTARHLEGHADVEVVIDFNPWMFSSAHELTGSLVSELAAQLAKHEKTATKTQAAVGKAVSSLNGYSKRLSVLQFVPGVAEFYGPAAKGLEAADKLLTSPQSSLQDQRRDAVAGLAALDRRIVVLLDDIDRLTQPEIRDLFRAVRLTASFPNVVYLMCLDEHVVARALSAEGMDGQAYLEKILTVTCRVPDVAPAQIHDLFGHGLVDVLEQTGSPISDSQEWRSVLEMVVYPLLGTMRDAKRVLTSLPVALRSFGDDLPVSDVVALETVRVLAPDLHRAITSCADALTTFPRDTAAGLLAGAHADEQGGNGLDPLLKADRSRGGMVARGLVLALFPRARTRLPGENPRPAYAVNPVRDGSVATTTGLELYLTHTLPTGIATRSSIERVDTSWGDTPALRAALADIPDDRLRDAYGRFTMPVEGLSAAGLQDGIEELLRRVASLRGREPGPFGRPMAHICRQPVKQVLPYLNPDQITQLAMRLIRDETMSLAGLAQLIALVTVAGDDRPVPDEDADTVAGAFWTRLIQSDTRLSELPDLVRVLHRYRPDDAPADQPAAEALFDPIVAAPAFASAASESWTATEGNETVSYLSQSEILEELYGGRDNLRLAFDVVRTHREAVPVEDEQRLAGVLSGLARYLEVDPSGSQS